MSNGFTDHFAPVAPGYAAFRPRYPDALFSWLGSHAPARRLAWDCATGSGQAAQGLANIFDRVIATDASAAQIAAAPPHPKISYRVAPATASGLGDESVDLVTVAQALHWFDLPRFYDEVARVLVPGGLLAVCTYGMPETGDERIDGLFQELYTSTLGGYWPPERKHVETGYRDLPFPFPELPPEVFRMELIWTLGEYVGFVRTWSAVVRFTQAKGYNPLDALEKVLSPLWGSRRSVRWPLAIRAGHKG